MNDLAILRKRALTPCRKKFKRGAQQRIAEYLGCSRRTVAMVLIGNEDEKWSFGKERMEKVKAIIEGDLPLFAKKTGPKVK